MSFTDTLFHQILQRPYRLNVVDHGGKGPVVIFLHGIASSSANWDHVVPLLKQNHRCVTIDLLGFGDSPKPTWSTYNVEDHLKSIHWTIKRLRLRKPYILVGHSLGGLLAARYTRLHPGPIQRLLLLSPPVYIHPEKLESKKARRRTSAYLTAYRFIRTHKRITPMNVSRLARILPLPKSLVINEHTWLPFVRSLEHCIENQTVIDDVARIKKPIYIFYGLFDQFIVPQNIQLLISTEHTTLYQLKVDHSVGKRYAKAVAQTLIEHR